MMYPQFGQTEMSSSNSFAQFGHLVSGFDAGGEGEGRLATPVPPQALHTSRPFGFGKKPTPLHAAHLPVPKQRGHCPVPPHPGQPPSMYLPLPLQAEQVPSMHCDENPSIRSSFPRYPGERVDQVQCPVPLHALHVSIRPKPSQILHWTLGAASGLPTRISVPQYMQYAFCAFSGRSISAPQLGHMAGMSLMSAMIPPY